MKGLVSRLVTPIMRVWFTSPYVGLGARGPQLRNFFNTLVVSERVENFSVGLVRTSGQILGLSRTPDNRLRGMIQNRLIFGGSGPETLAVEWSGLGTGLGFERKFGPDWYHRWPKISKKSE
jgi:hypothetical protein